MKVKAALILVLVAVLLAPLTAEAQAGKAD